jgi:cytochrome c
LRPIQPIRNHLLQTLIRQSGSKCSWIEQPNFNSKGKEAFSEFRQRGSEWFSGDTYIFAYAPDGTVVLNPAFPAREGHAYHGEKDKKGKAFHDEIMKTAQTKGSGWVDYWLPKPGQIEPSQKWSYVKAVKAEGVAVVGAGFFPE